MRSVRSGDSCRSVIGPVCALALLAFTSPVYRGASMNMRARHGMKRSVRTFIPRTAARLGIEDVELAVVASGNQRGVNGSPGDRCELRRVTKRIARRGRTLVPSCAGMTSLGLAWLPAWCCACVAQASGEPSWLMAATSNRRSSDWYPMVLSVLKNSSCAEYDHPHVRTADPIFPSSPVSSLLSSFPAPLSTNRGVPIAAPTGLRVPQAE